MSDPTAKGELTTVRDYLRYAVSRFNAAQLFFGHGSDNAWDEAVYLTLHTLHLPLDRLEPFLDARLLAHERTALLTPIGDPDALARGLARVLADTDLADRLRPTRGIQGEEGLIGLAAARGSARHASRRRDRSGPSGARRPASAR